MSVVAAMSCKRSIALEVEAVGEGSMARGRMGVVGGGSIDEIEDEAGAETDGDFLARD
jgi:hypothetical protein